MNFDELDKLCRDVWGAYEYLRDHDLSGLSGTSKRLRSKDTGKLRARLLEELNELRGVIEGTHFHQGFAEDIILEGYEVLYWTFSLAIAQNLTYSQLEPAQQLIAGFETFQKTRVDLLPYFTPVNRDVTMNYDEPLPALLARVIFLVGQSCAVNNTLPNLLLERDRAEMRQKEYLTAYWN